MNDPTPLRIVVQISGGKIAFIHGTKGLSANIADNLQSAIINHQDTVIHGSISMNFGPVMIKNLSAAHVEIINWNTIVEHEQDIPAIDEILDGLACLYRRKKPEFPAPPSPVNKVA